MTRRVITEKCNPTEPIRTKFLDLVNSGLIKSVETKPHHNTIFWMGDIDNILMEYNTKQERFSCSNLIIKHIEEKNKYYEQEYIFNLLRLLVKKYFSLQFVKK